MEKKKAKDILADTYAFPTKSQCRRCRGTQTRAVSTQGKVQYRKCMSPICQHRYTVIGTKV